MGGLSKRLSKDYNLHVPYNKIIFFVSYLNMVLRINCRFNNQTKNISFQQDSTFKKWSNNFILPENL